MKYHVASFSKRQTLNLMVHQCLALADLYPCRRCLAVTVWQAASADHGPDIGRFVCGDDVLDCLPGFWLLSLQAFLENSSYELPVQSHFVSGKCYRLSTIIKTESKHCFCDSTWVLAGDCGSLCCFQSVYSLSDSDTRYILPYRSLDEICLESWAASRIWCSLRTQFSSRSRVSGIPNLDIMPAVLTGILKNHCDPWPRV